MIIGSSHGVGGGPTQTEVLSTVVAQLEPIHATCMEEVNKNIDQIIQYMEIGARGFPGSACRACTRWSASRSFSRWIPPKLAA